MNLWLGYGGLATAFVILAVVLLWIIIQAPGGYLLKAILIPPVIWYGVALYFTVPNLMGWPATGKLPENSVLLAVRIKEPSPLQNNPGAIYLWVHETAGRGATNAEAGSRGAGKNPLDPRRLFKYANPSDPRAYKMPYTRKMHEAIVKAQSRLKATPGALMKVQRNTDRKGSGEEQQDSSIMLEIVRPREWLPKTGTQPEMFTPNR